MTPKQRKRLRELAMEATPGPWRFVPENRDVPYDDAGHESCNQILADKQRLMGDECYYPWAPEPSDMEFIAAANPTAVIELLDENEKAIAALKQIAAGEGQIQWNDCCCGNLAQEALQ